MGSGANWYQIGKNILYSKVSNFYVEKGYLCQQFPMELNFEGLQMQKWNIPTNRARRGDDKNGVLCLVIMFTPGVMVIKMLKMAHFYHLGQVTVTTQHLRASERFYLALSENAMDVGFWAIISKIWTLEDTKFCYFLLTQQSFWYFYPRYLTNSNSKTY